jgi:ribosome maturation factor RimP
MEIRERLLGLIEPVVISLGYELVDVEFVSGSPDAALRVYIDWPEGIAPEGLVTEGDEENRSFEGIGVEDCEKVSRELSALLDVEDPIPQAYALEVSSPGVDRILRTAKHFQRFVGERVHVELKLARDGRRRYTGQMTRADEAGIELNVDGEPVALSLADIGKARLAPDWSKQSARRKARK